MKTLFIINPISGKGKGRNQEKMLRQIDAVFGPAGYDYTVRMWDAPGRITELIDFAIEEGFDAVVAAGGDGTINEIGKRLVGTGIALGVLPMGSGNGFARHLGYSRKPRIAISQLLRAKAMEVDIGNFGGIPFMNNAGIGIDAAVAEQFAHSGKRGLKTYVKLASRTFLNFKSFDCTLIVDGEREYTCSGLMLMDIANGTQWGNGAKIAPFSKIGDGYLEAIMMQKTPFIEIPRLIKLLFSGKLYRHPNVKYVRGKSFEIIRHDEGNAHVDGEHIRLGSTINCNVVEKSMRLLVPETREVV